MTNRNWLNQDGSEYFADITKDYNGRNIDYGNIYYESKGQFYKITNIETGKSLIKGEIDLKSMENRFNFSVSINSCINPKLQSDWKKYGPKSFKFEIYDSFSYSATIASMMAASSIPVTSETAAFTPFALIFS